MNVRRVGRIVVALSLLPSIASSQQIKTADDFALILQHNFQQNGYDVNVRANHQHELILLSDSFQDAATRDAATRTLAKDPATLCSLGIWYIKAGYSKGMVSSDVMKTASLQCPAAKAAHIDETKPLRDEIASAANDPDGSGRLHVHAQGTTLVIESAYFFDDPESGASYAKAMAKSLLASSDKLCAAAITRLQMRGSSRVIKTVPVVCK